MVLTFFDVFIATFTGSITGAIGSATVGGSTAFGNNPNKRFIFSDLVNYPLGHMYRVYFYNEQGYSVPVSSQLQFEQPSGTAADYFFNGVVPATIVPASNTLYQISGYEFYKIQDRTGGFRLFYRAI